MGYLKGCEPEWAITEECVELLEMHYQTENTKKGQKFSRARTFFFFGGGGGKKCFHGLDHVPLSLTNFIFLPDFFSPLCALHIDKKASPGG